MMHVEYIHKIFFKLYSAGWVCTRVPTVHILWWLPFPVKHIPVPVHAPAECSYSLVVKFKSF